MCVASLAVSAQKKDQPVTMAVAPTKMNVLFIGVPNLLDIAVSGYKDDDLIVSSNTVRITREGEGRYNVSVKSLSKTVVIRICAKTKRDTIEIGQREFRIKRVPDPVPRVAGVGSNVERGGFVTKAEIYSAVGLEAYCAMDYELDFSIVSFEVSANIDGNMVSARTDGALFSQAQKEIIRKLNPDDKVYIEEIKCKAPDGSIRDLESLAFKIKELD